LAIIALALDSISTVGYHHRIYHKTCTIILFNAKKTPPLPTVDIIVPNTSTPVCSSVSITVSNGSDGSSDSIELSPVTGVFKCNKAGLTFG
jgi:hypothetical protein